MGAVRPALRRAAPKSMRGGLQMNDNEWGKKESNLQCLPRGNRFTVCRNTTNCYRFPLYTPPTTLLCISGVFILFNLFNLVPTAKFLIVSLCFIYKVRRRVYTFHFFRVLTAIIIFLKSAYLLLLSPDVSYSYSIPPILFILKSRWYCFYIICILHILDAFLFNFLCNFEANLQKMFCFLQKRPLLRNTCRVPFQEGVSWNLRLGIRSHKTQHNKHRFVH